MQLLIAGGTGFIGSALISTLVKRGERIRVYTRDQNSAKAKRLIRHCGGGVAFTESLSGLQTLNDFDAVINLVGEPIANKRWTDKQKREIERSRWDVTTKLSELIAASDHPPGIFLNGSAIGYYGAQDSKQITEDFDAPYPDFGHRLCAQTERLANRAQSEQTRVCHLRTGVVLAAQGGALQRMRPPFQFGFGSAIGSGEQYMSWIHIDDMIAGLLFLLDHGGIEGPINFTAPGAVTNLEFSRKLATSLNRPFFMPAIPVCAMRFAFGEMAELLIYGQNVYPKVLLDAGFEFEYPTIEAALRDLSTG